MNGCGEEAEAGEEKAEGELQEEGEEGGDLEHLPLRQGWIAILASAQTLLGDRVFDRQVLAEPLFHEDAEGSRREAEEETREPEDVDTDCPQRRLEGRRGGGCSRGVDEPWSGDVMLRRDLLQEPDDDVLGILLQVRVRLNDECGQDRRVETSL